MNKDINTIKIISKKNKLSIPIKPIKSQKAYELFNNKNCISFTIHSLVTKDDIKKYFSLMFTDIKSINIANYKPVCKRTKNIIGTKKGYKKVYVYFPMTFKLREQLKDYFSVGQ